MRKNNCNVPDFPLFRKVFAPKLEDASLATGSQRIHICTFLLVYSQYLLIFSIILLNWEILYPVEVFLQGRIMYSEGCSRIPFVENPDGRWH